MYGLDMSSNGWCHPIKTWRTLKTTSYESISQFLVELYTRQLLKAVFCLITYTSLISSYRWQLFDLFPMDSKKMDIGSKDLISSLPDVFICHILFLSIKDVALTSILTKRWRCLLAFVTISILRTPSTTLLKWVDRKGFICVKALSFCGQSHGLAKDAPLNKISLWCRIGSGPSRVNGWIFKVLECCVFILIYTSLRQTSIHFLDRF